MFVQLEVHEAKAILDNHPQWDIPDTEEEDEEQEDSDGIEESEDDDEDNDWARAYALSPPLPPPFTLSWTWPHIHCWPRSSQKAVSEEQRSHKHSQSHQGQFLHTEPSSI